jgi:steroid 5-alpha reductase family enzyme
MMKQTTKGRLVLLFVYTIAMTLGFWVSRVSDYPVLVQSAVAVGLAVSIIFVGSVDFNNSSVFDPYWSVAPPLIVVYYWIWMVGQLPGDGSYWSVITGSHLVPGQADYAAIPSWPDMTRIVVVMVLTLAYSIRLTWNFLRGWPGLKHEDWRYANFRKRSGKAYWVVSFFGIHLFPAMMVFGGTLSLWVVVIHGATPLNLLDLLALLITGSAILLEAIADRQLRHYALSAHEPGKTLRTGLWSRSRHPNYIGEMLFWWGLYCFALAANPTYWWVIIGPLTITFMFVFISIPMIEKRMLERRSDYEDYRKKVPMLFRIL